ncbi:HNH endonuclease [Francisella philomiragia]|uniref:HNH endonuclease n=1 Tax=Francisella philomiragia TaxID=28110 RepID=UPI001F367453|nr:HNH endonuclease [Francisella philomiragia]
MSFQVINIDGCEYYIVDSIQNLRAEDSFIYRKNKLVMHGGNGESRKYVGSYNGQNGDRLRSFFEYKNWGLGKDDKGKRIYTPIQSKCFFSKSNLLKYLYDSRVEYQKQEQVYKHNISDFYHDRIETVRALNSDKIFFSIYDVSDFADKKTNRGYIRSDDYIWDIWRKLVLPKISYLSILKLIPINKKIDSTPLFYFRVFLDYQFRSIVHPKLSSSIDSDIVNKKMKESSKKTVSREGQQLYRKKVIDHMPQCPFTKISDERLLIASHIKPYKTCIDENRVEEAIDFYNGLALSPTYDKLFDQGYITFTDRGELVCGTLLTPYTWERLNINPNAKNVMRIYPEGREDYLKFHRENVFQDDINQVLNK